MLVYDGVILELPTPGSDRVHQALVDVDLVPLHVLQAVNEAQVRESVSVLQDLVVRGVPD